MPLHPKERAALSRLRQILNDPALNLLRANIVRRKIRCGRSGCRCRLSTKQGHPVCYVSQSRKGKFRTKYVPTDKIPSVRDGVALYQEARGLLMALGDASWDRIGS
mgnify:CR=1 FL=1